MDELENVVAAFYMKSFFEQFQWTPVLPHGLSHVIEPYQVPVQSAIVFLDPAPNTFYDLSLLTEY